MIRRVENRDVAGIADIYNYYVENSVATFEEEKVMPAVFDERIRVVESYGLPWLVAQEGGVVVGYAYATRWQQRSAYRHTVETTVYLSPERLSQGWGTKLYDALFSGFDDSIHVIIGGVTLPNAASVALHEKFGMKKVAHFEQVGFKFGQWLDVGYWQCHRR